MSDSLKSMEIIKKEKNQKKYTKPNKFKKYTKPNKFFEKYLLTQKICEQKSVPKEIQYYIMQYHIALKNNDLLRLLKKENPTMVAWDNAHIPINYYHLLNSTQIGFITDILLSPQRIYLYHPLPQCKARKKHLPCSLDYFLQSEKDYEFFLTLPIDLRKCLAQAPKSLINQACKLQENPHYNGKSIPIIQVKSNLTEINHTALKLCNRPINADFFGYTPRLIVPEEKNHKK